MNNEYMAIYNFVQGLDEALSCGGGGRVHLRRASDGQVLSDLGDAVRAILTDDLQAGGGDPEEEPDAQ